MKQKPPSFGAQMAAEWKKFKEANGKCFDIGSLTGAAYLENRLFNAFAAGADAAKKIVKAEGSEG